MNKDFRVYDVRGAIRKNSGALRAGNRKITMKYYQANGRTFMRSDQEETDRYNEAMTKLGFSKIYSKHPISGKMTYRWQRDRTPQVIPTTKEIEF